jgi:hypothetical protein
MSHAFLFFLQSLFLYHVISWYREKRGKHLLFAAFFAGFCVLIRPTEAIILLLPLLIGIFNRDSMKEKISLLLQNKALLIFALLIFILPILPQIIYWKTYTGKFIFYSYGDEGFFFSDPQIIRFLFGYRKGLIPYAPMLAFALLGFVVLFIKHRNLFWAMFIFTMVNIYVLSCWWDYGFGGGVGNRALIQSFTVLAFPLAALLNFFIGLSTSKIIKSITVCLLLSTVYYCADLNLIMTKQFKKTILHWAGMNKETYWFIFKRLDFNSDDFAKRERLIQEPNYEAMKKGDRDQ